MTRRSSATKARIALVQFPGSNCDVDCRDVLERRFGLEVVGVWHTETALPRADAVVLPGGFSYGDYLRGGALASHSPLMREVKAHVDAGGAAIGICNGFQVLTETHILPGALLHNASRRFACRHVGLRTGRGTSTWHATLADRVLSVPVAHGEGRYYIDDEGLKRLEGEGQVAFRYVNNPNGSVDDIAGIVSTNGRVLGLMPHPERACDAELSGSSADGLAIWEAFLASFL